LASVPSSSGPKEDRVPTGIAEFDSLIEGGFPRGDLVLLAGHPGSGKTIFSAQFLYHGASKFGEPGIYVSFAENRAAFLRNMKRTGMDFEALEQQEKFKFLDLVTVKSVGVDDILGLVFSQIGTMKAKRLVIDSYSALAQAFSDKIDSRIILHTILGKMVRLAGATTLLISEKPLGAQMIGGGMEEFVADGVVILLNSSSKGVLKRKLQVAKMRGTRAQTREIVYDIGEDGLKLYPPTEPVPVQRVFSERVKTGIQGLDRMLDGGPFKGSIILISGPSGTGRTTAGLQFIAEGAANGEKGVLVSFEESAEQLIKQGSSFGWNIRSFIAKGTVTIASFVPQPDNVEKILKQLGRVLAERMPSRVVVDGLSEFAGLIPEEEAAQWIKASHSVLRNLGVTTVETMTSDGEGSFLESRIAGIADVIISLRHVESEGNLEKALVIVKATGSSHDSSIREFEITSKGMVVKEKFGRIGRSLGGSAGLSEESFAQRKLGAAQ
jgi:circadian clock protein KaiC